MQGRATGPTTPAGRMTPMSERRGRRAALRPPVSTARRRSIAALGAMLGAALMVVGAPNPADAAEVAPDPALITYLKLADSACADARKVMAATLPTYEKHKAASKSVTGGSGNKLATPTEVEAYIKANISVLEGQQKRLQLLKAPDRQKVEITAIYADADKAIALIRSAPRKAPFSDPLRSIAARAKALGFTECYQAKRPATVAG